MEIEKMARHKHTRTVSINNRSGYRGVCWHQAAGKWLAQFTFDKKRVFKKFFDDPEEASREYEKERSKYLSENDLVPFYATDEKKKRAKEWVLKNTDKVNAIARIGYAKNKAIIREKARQRIWERKLEIIKEYGGECKCCGENNPEFLTIDHINNNGNVHRKEIISGNFYNWLKHNDYPKDNYQLLCCNCNFSKGLLGYCPHQINRQEFLKNLKEKNE
jgi:hypothetical protein